MKKKILIAIIVILENVIFLFVLITKKQINIKTTKKPIAFILKVVKIININIYVYLVLTFLLNKIKLHNKKIQTAAK